MISGGNYKFRLCLPLLPRADRLRVGKLLGLELLRLEADSLLHHRRHAPLLIGHAQVDIVHHFGHVRFELGRSHRCSREQAVQAQDSALYCRLDVEFHETMVSFAGNRKLYLLYRRLTRELALFRRRNLAAQSLLTGSIQEHREVLAPIRSRNTQLAADTLRRHVQQSRERTARSGDAVDATGKTSS